MIAWLKANRPEGHEAARAPAEPAPVPDGAIMVKEMFPPPVSHCADVDMLRLFPQNGAAILVRDAGALFDGWFWGWSEGSWVPDWPATQVNAYPNMGFGLYCTNCHSSARDNQTFASLRNIAGEPGEPLAYLSHDFFLAPHFETGGDPRVQRSGAPPQPAQERFLTHHEEVAERRKLQPGLRQARPYSPAFTDVLRLLAAPPPKDIDLADRTDFAKHTLVGLNAFLVRMAKQFPQVLGIRTEDPMLPPRHGAEPLATTEAAILDQAARSTAEVGIGEVARADGTLSAKVKIVNQAGHKFPSGVALRRAFVEFSVLDAGGKVLWASGRTKGAGVIVDGSGAPIAGELWWQADCSSRIEPAYRAHQPHHQIVTRQDQAQIYQELASAPPDVDAPSCGAHGKPEGPLTTSFLSICTKVKDNRLLPHGFLPLAERAEIAGALGAKQDLAEEVAPTGVGDDPDYAQGGGDETLYRIPLAELGGEPASVRAALYYQATPLIICRIVSAPRKARTPSGSITSPASWTYQPLRSRTGSCKWARPWKRRCPEHVAGRLRSPLSTRHLQGRSPRKKRSISREASGPCGSV